MKKVTLSIFTLLMSAILLSGCGGSMSETDTALIFTAIGSSVSDAASCGNGGSCKLDAMSADVQPLSSFSATVACAAGGSVSVTGTYTSNSVLDFAMVYSDCQVVHGGKNFTLTGTFQYTLTYVAPTGTLTILGSITATGDVSGTCDIDATATTTGSTIEASGKICGRDFSGIYTT